MSAPKKVEEVTVLKLLGSSPAKDAILSFADKEMEQALLGSVLLKPDIFPLVGNEVKSADFFADYANGFIWLAFQELTKQGDPIEFSTVVSFLAKYPDAKVTVPLLTRMCQGIVPNPDNCRVYARGVREAALRARLAHAVELQKSYVADKSKSLSDCLLKIEGETLALATPILGRKPQDAIAQALAWSDSIEERISNKGMNVIGTGMSSTDDLLTGFPVGECTYICGSAGLGKTSLMTSFLYWQLKTAVKVGELVLWYALEMSTFDMLTKLAQHATGISARAMRRGDITPAQAQETLEFAQWWATQPVSVIDEFPAMSLTQLEIDIKRHKMRGNVSIVYVDGLWLMGMENEEGDLGELTKGLNRLARQENIAIVITHQLNQDAKGRSSKRPLLTDLKGGQPVQQDPQTVLALYRPNYWDIDTDDTTELVVLKSRNGLAEVGSSAKIEFNKPRGLYQPLSQRE